MPIYDMNAAGTAFETGNNIMDMNAAGTQYALQMAYDMNTAGSLHKLWDVELIVFENGISRYGNPTGYISDIPVDPYTNFNNGIWTAGGEGRNQWNLEQPVLFAGYSYINFHVTDSITVINNYLGYISEAGIWLHVGTSGIDHAGIGRDQTGVISLPLTGAFGYIALQSHYMNAPARLSVSKIWLS